MCHEWKNMILSFLFYQGEHHLFQSIKSSRYEYSSLLQVRRGSNKFFYNRFCNLIKCLRAGFSWQVQKHKQWFCELHASFIKPHTVQRDLIIKHGVFPLHAQSTVQAISTFNIFYSSIGFLDFVSSLCRSFCLHLSLCCFCFKTFECERLQLSSPSLLNEMETLIN